jgi:hypothetical protein
VERIPRHDGILPQACNLCPARFGDYCNPIMTKPSGALYFNGMKSNGCPKDTITEESPVSVQVELRKILGR